MREAVLSLLKRRNAKVRKCDVCRRPYPYIRASSKCCSSRCRVAALRRRRKRSVHFRSDSYEWSTPDDLFSRLDLRFRFDLDVCASAQNAKCERHYTRDDDGLSQPWMGVCWMNPPYGREIGKWVAKAYAASLNGATVVCLLPARTDTAWWHQFVGRAANVTFLKGRLRFGGQRNAAPFPSAIVVFSPTKNHAADLEVEA